MQGTIDRATPAGPSWTWPTSVRAAAMLHESLPEGYPGLGALALHEGEVFFEDQPFEPLLLEITRVEGE